MHVLYVDESGSARNPNERYFVLAGVAVFERGLYHLIRAADQCVESFGLGDPHAIELHGNAMYAGRDGVWRTVRNRPAREEMIKRALATMVGQRSAVTLFSVVVDKTATAAYDPVELAFEEICNRFNLFLRRELNRHSDDQRGLIVMDETDREEPLQRFARTLRNDGGRWGHFRKLAEVPLFVNSKASRLVQLADLVAYATWRKYQHADGRFFDPLIPLFDQEGGTIHGLVHRRSPYEECFCPACFSRRHGLAMASLPSPN